MIFLKHPSFGVRRTEFALYFCNRSMVVQQDLKDANFALQICRQRVALIIELCYKSAVPYCSIMMHLSIDYTFYAAVNNGAKMKRLR